MVVQVGRLGGVEDRKHHPGSQNDRLGTTAFGGVPAGGQGQPRVGIPEPDPGQHPGGEDQRHAPALEAAPGADLDRQRMVDGGIVPVMGVVEIGLRRRQGRAGGFPRSGQGDGASLPGAVRHGFLH